MSGVATAIGGAAILGSIVSSNASSNAASDQLSAANNADQLQWNMYQQTRTDNQPALDARNNALSQLQGSNGIGNFNFSEYTDPSAQYAMGQGQDALSRASANKGGMLSGSNMSALDEYSQQMGNQAYSNAYNRYQSNIGNLMSLAGLGQNAGAQTTSAGTSASNSIANTMTSAGNASAAGAVGTANAYTSGINGVANAYGNYNTLSQLGNSSNNNWAAQNIQSYPSGTASGTGGEF